MSHRPSTEDHKEACRLQAFPWLPGSDFDDALAQAHSYHRDNPPLELVERVAMTDIPLKESERNFVARVNCSTKRKLLAEHRERLMRPFVAKDVPPTIAGLIVDTLVLGLAQDG